MRSLPLLIGLFVCQGVSAQVRIGTSVSFTGPAEQRHVEGLATPSSDSAAITVSATTSGVIHWATSNWASDTLVLDVEPGVSAYRDGLLLRFLPPANNTGRTWLKVSGLAASPLIRHDGLALPPGALRIGTVAEVLHANGSWILLNASAALCPPGSVAVNARLCMDVVATPGLLFYAAMGHCTERGGKLCTWDEYVAGCTLIGSQLNGLFDEWEWLDDTSNHTHTADQVGRFTCQSQRAANVITMIPGDARCCYHPR